MLNFVQFSRNLVISISEYIDTKKIYQNYFFAKSCLSSVFGEFYGPSQHRTTVSRDFAIFVVRGAYLGHFENGNFRNSPSTKDARQMKHPRRKAQEAKTHTLK